jgi:hypothetical protein
LYGLAPYDIMACNGVPRNVYSRHGR